MADVTWLVEPGRFHIQQTAQRHRGFTAVEYFWQRVTKKSSSGSVGYGANCTAAVSTVDAVRPGAF